MAEQDWHYQAYLLRLWWTGRGEQRVLRASLEDPHIRVRIGFGSLEQLLAFLKWQISDAHREQDDLQGGVDEL